MKHTKGTWTIADYHVDNGNIQIGSDKDYICMIYPLPDDEASRKDNALQSAANAKLIAAAPELLEACHAVLNRFGCDRKEVASMSLGQKLALERVVDVINKVESNI